MRKITIAARILPEWASEIKLIMAETGSTQTEVLEEAIGLYLKKSRRLRVAARLEAIERRLDKIAQIATK